MADPPAAGSSSHLLDVLRGKARQRQELQCHNNFFLHFFWLSLVPSNLEPHCSWLIYHHKLDEPKSTLRVAPHHKRCVPRGLDLGKTTEGLVRFAHSQKWIKMVVSLVDLVDLVAIGSWSLVFVGSGLSLGASVHRKKSAWWWRCVQHLAMLQQPIMCLYLFFVSDQQKVGSNQPCFISQFYATIRGMNIQQFCKGFMQSLWRVVSQQMPQGFQGQRLKPQDFAENVWQEALVTSEVKSDGEKTKWSASDTTTPYLLVNKAKLMMQTKGNNLRFYFDNDKI